MIAPDPFERLLEERIPQLRGYAYSLVRNRDLADDLVQDTLLRAWAARDLFVRGTNLKAWMFTILRNRFLDYLRTNRFSDRPLDENVTRHLVTPPPQEAAVYFDEMARAYWQMAPNQRQILMLVGGAGLGYEEAGKVAGCAVGTVRSRLSRARAKLRTMLETERLNGGPQRRTPRRGAAEFMQALAGA